MRRLLTAIGLLALVAGVYLVAATSGGNESPGPSAEQLPQGVQGLEAGSRGSKRPPMPPVEINLVDQHGIRLTQQRLVGRPSVFAFVSPVCDGECPVLLDQVRGSFDRLGGLAGQVQLIVVPTDQPSKHDLARLARRRAIAGALIAAGPPSGIRRTLREFAVSLGPAEQSLGYLVVVDRDLRQRFAYVAHTLAPEALEADLRTLIKASAR